MPRICTCFSSATGTFDSKMVYFSFKTLRIKAQVFFFAISLSIDLTRDPHSLGMLNESTMGSVIKSCEQNSPRPPPFFFPLLPKPHISPSITLEFPKTQSLAYLNNNSYTNTLWHPTQMHRQSQMQMHVCFVPNSGHHSVFSAWLHAYLALADLS